MSEKLLFSRKEAAQRLGLSVQSIDLLTHSGRLPVVKVGNRVMVHGDTLAEFAKTGTSQNISKAAK